MRRWDFSRPSNLGCVTHVTVSFGCTGGSALCSWPHVTFCLAGKPRFSATPPFHTLRVEFLVLAHASWPRTTEPSRVRCLIISARKTRSSEARELCDEILDLYPEDVSALRMQTLLRQSKRRRIEEDAEQALDHLDEMQIGTIDSGETASGSSTAVMLSPRGSETTEVCRTPPLFRLRTSSCSMAPLLCRQAKEGAQTARRKRLDFLARAPRRFDISTRPIRPCGTICRRRSRSS